MFIYNSSTDFTTLEAWKKARLVKIFFYREVIPNLTIDEKFNLILKSDELQLVLQQIFQKGMVATTIKKGFSFTG